MKKLFVFLAAVILTAHLFAQAPQGMSYQTVIRNANNSLATNRSVCFRMSILKTSSTGAPVYIETHSTSTNASGLANIEIGLGHAETGVFTSINWADGPFYIKTEIDPTGGQNYTISGTSQLLNVPYALYSEKSGTSADGVQTTAITNPGDMNYWNGTNWVVIPVGLANQTLILSSNNIPTWAFLLPNLGLTEITTINATNAIARGNVIRDGGMPIISRGICWNTFTTPTTNQNIVVATGTVGVFTSTINGLNTGTNYYVRSYATNSVGTAYGTEISFTTITLPTIETIRASGIESTSAWTGGNLISNGGGMIISMGVCWDERETLPTTNNSVLLAETLHETEFTIQLGSDYLNPLTPNTTYYVRAFAENIAGIGYGDPDTFTTLTVPTITTSAVSSITSTNAISGGNVISDGGTTVRSRGVCWSRNTNPETSGNYLSAGSGIGSFTCAVGDLLYPLNSGVSYHVRAFATNSVGTAYGADLNFTTSAVLPTVTTSSISSITSTNAISGGNATTDGGALITDRGICWSSSQNPITNSLPGSPQASAGTGTGTFVCTVGAEPSWLEAASTYYVRAYAVNSIGTAYGMNESFTTLAALPTIETAPVDHIATTTAWGGGNVISDGGVMLTSIGICWDKRETLPTVNNSVLYAYIEDYEFTLQLGSESENPLTPNTKYYVRAFAENEIGMAYGNTEFFTTAIAPTVPTVTTSAISSITSTSAISGGNATSDGGTSITARGICWSTSQNPVTNSLPGSSQASAGTGTGTFVCTVGAEPGWLQAATTYYVRAYAVNTIGTAYGTNVNFTTLATVPTVETIPVEHIGSTTAWSGGIINSDGGAMLISMGVCWDKRETLPTTNNAFLLADTEGSSFDLQLGSGFTNPLTPNTTYYVRAFAENEIGIGYGNTESFTTEIALTMPSVTASAITSISSATAIGGGNITNIGSSPVTARGVCWSTTVNPTTSIIISDGGSGPGTFTCRIPSGHSGALTPNTQYYVRAYGTNSTGTGYSTAVSFTTLPATPVLSATIAATSITTTSAISGGNVTSDGGASVTERGVCWSEKMSPTIASPRNIAALGTGVGTFTCAVGGAFQELTANTIYSVRSYATNIVGTAYGLQMSFTTLSAFPSLAATTAATSITSTSAISGGNVTSDGGTTVTERGVCWKIGTTPQTVDDDYILATSAGVGTFSCTMGNMLQALVPGTLYYVRSFATNSVGTAYGAEINFTTLPAIPILATTTVATSITNSSAESGGEVISGLPIINRGLCWSTSSRPTSDGTHVSCGTGLGVFTGTVGGYTYPLTSFTTYYVRAYAHNSIGDAYGSAISFKTLSGIPTLASTTAVSAITTTSAVSGGNVIHDGGESVKTRGVCWGKYYLPTTTENPYTLDGNGVGTFSSAITGLESGTTYYVRSYASNTIGTAYNYPSLSFNTSSVAPIITATLVPSGITNSSAVVGGEILRDGGNPILERGVYFSTTPRVTDEGSPFAIAGTGTGSFSGTKTLLQPNTQYYILAYARNSIGTGFAPTVLNFTTLAYNPNLPVVLTGAVSLITSSDATGSGNVTSAGTTPVTSRGVCWSPTVNPVTNTFGTGSATSGAGTGSFSCPLIDTYDTQLTPGTVYFVRAFAKNTAGTVYGDQVSFKTLPVLPTIAPTTPASSITAYSAVSGGNITNDGGAPVTGRGICWSSSQNPVLSGMAGGPDCYAGTGTGTFACTVGQDEQGWLQPASTYYVRAYATNSIGTVYAGQISFRTLAERPTLSVTTTSEITSTSAISGGEILNDGGDVISERGICWNSSGQPTTTDSKTIETGSERTYTCAMRSLSPGTTYFVRAYAINGIGTNYGAEITFTTLNYPSVTTSTVTSITSTSAISGGNVTSDGGTTVTERGVCWRIGNTPQTVDDDYNLATSLKTGVFTCAVGNKFQSLIPGMQYYVRSFATNSVGTAYGTNVIFTTLVTVPTITTTAATSITSTSAVSGGNVISDGGASIKDRGLCWSIFADPTSDDSNLVDDGSLNTFSGTISSLSPGTTYSVRSFAINSVGTAYGNQISFKTLAILPTLSTTAASSITSTNAISGGNITNDGGAAVSSRGICWAISQNPELSGMAGGPDAYAGSGTGTFSCTVGSDEGGQLQPGKTYYVRAFAINSVGTTYGNQISFKTLPILPIITTSAATSITSTSAVSGGSIISDGGASIKDRGICWSVFANPTSDDSNFVDDGSLNTFSGTISSLSPGTTYSVRSFAINSVGTAYGNQINFKTSPTLPSITTAAATSITSTNAISGGNITSDGGATVSSRGICWATSQNPELSGMAGGPDAYAGSGTGTFSCTVGSDEWGQLQPGKTYYVRAFAINSVGTTYGNQISFKTLPILPIITTSAATSITSSSAVSGGNVISDGGASIKDRGLCWSIFADPTSDDSNLVDDGSLNTFSGTISSLSPGTTYSVRSFAINSVGTAYGNQISFKTLAILPTLSTTAASSITSTNAISGGNITNDGGAAVSSRGICWAISQNPELSGMAGGPDAYAGSGTGTFSCTVGSDEGGQLQPGKTYYVRAFAINSVGTTYGNQISFKTLPILPIITTSAATSITSTSAVSGGSIISDGGASIKDRGICWSVFANPTSDDSNFVDDGSLNTFSGTISSLSPGTTYSVRSFAINSVGTAYGNQINFKTSPTLPSITTAAATSITSTNAISGGNITSDGGATVSSRGICWATSQNPELSGMAGGPDAYAGSGTGTFSCTVGSDEGGQLQPGKTYYVRAFAINSVGTTYGNQISFKTLPILPIITTSAATSITSSSAVSGGNVISDGGASIKDRGLCWSIFANPTSDDSNLVDDGSLNTFSGTISSLSPGTTYSVRSFAINSVGTAYGNQISFKTLPTLPSTTTAAATSITSTSAVSGGNVTNDGGAAVSNRGICWATTQSPVTGSRIGGPQANAGTGTGIFTCVVGYEEGGWLESGSTYYVRSFATNSAGTTYGDQISFKTLAIPSVTTSAVTSITSTNAISGGNITSDGGAAVNRRGVCWSTKPTPSTDSDRLSAGAGIGTFTCTFPDSRISQLTTGVGYFVRAYAINSAGTAYGADVSFTTLAVPSITTAAATSITSTSAISGGSIISDGGASIKDRGLCWSIFADPTSDDSNLVDDGSLNTFSGTISSLSPGTTYSVRSFAINSVGTAYGNQINFKTLPTLPSITTAAATSITSTNAISGGNITSDGGATVNNRGICWATSQNPELSGMAGGPDAYAGSGTGTFSCTVGSDEWGQLQPGKTYYVRAFAINSVGTTYGNQISFKTLPILPIITTSAATSITSSSAVSGGNVISDGGASIKDRGLCWSIFADPTSDDSNLVDDGSLNTFSGTISSLSPGTTYSVRSFAINSAGTAYGNQISFKTLPTLPSITTAAATSITSTNAISGGNITSDGGATVSSRGICWSTSQNPVTSSKLGANQIFAGFGTGIFSCAIENGTLAPSTIYYVRAFALNSIGTAYGSEISFTTLAPVRPTLATTTAANSITSTSAISGGNILNDGGDIISERGICWNLIGTPTTNDSKTIETGSENAFTCIMNSLSPGTTYFVRSYATNRIGTNYGIETTFATLTTLPQITTSAVTSITSTSAISGGNITSDGGAAVNNRGVCWSVNKSPRTDGDRLSAGSGIGAFTCTFPDSRISQLTTGVGYFVRAYAINSVGTAYGANVSFTTLAVPSITTAAATSITSTSAISGGSIISDGGASIKDRGICWSIFADPTSDDSNLVDDGSLNTFSGTISSLSPGTTYSVRSFAINSVGTAYGNQISFKTLPTLPSTTTAAATSITSTNAISGGNITSDGGATVSSRGICWSTSQNPELSGMAGGPDAYAGSGTGTFSCTVGSDEAGQLQPGKTYYVRAFAINSVGTTYGNQISFKTLPILPIITTSAVTSITSSSAVSGGNVISDGGASIKDRGLCWSIFANPTSDDSNLVDDGSLNTFSGTISPLSPGTTYSVRSFAINSVGTAYGNQISFKTLPILPTLSTTAASSITASSAISGGNVTNDGGATVSSRGICWATTQSPVTGSRIGGPQANAGTGTGIFTCVIGYEEGGWLESGSTYYVRSFATNSAGTTYGDQISFKTLAIPSVTTSAVTSVTSTNAISGGNVISDGGTAVTARGVCWSTKPTPSTDSDHLSAGLGIGAFTCTFPDSRISQLTTGVGYFVRAYAINSVGTAYGADVSFTTLAVPSITTAAATSITSTSAISGGNVISDGGASIKDRGLCWSIFANPTSDDSNLVDDGFLNTFSGTISSLSPGTTYSVRSFAINSVGTAYGNQISFKTLAILPTLSTTAASSITSTNAISGGNITSDGGATVSSRGICWSTSQNPELSGMAGGPDAYAGSGTGTFSCTVGSDEWGQLQPGKTYYVRAFAINSVGITYGNQISFKTLPILPIITTAAVTSITSTSAISGGSIISDGGASIKDRGICWSVFANPTSDDSNLVDDGFLNTFSGTISSLSPGTTYSVRSFAINSVGTAYGNQISFKTLPTLPSTTTAAATSITSTNAISGGNITSDGGATVSSRGICWSTSQNPELSGMAGGPDAYAGSGTGTFSCTVGSDEAGQLQPGKTYYVRAFAINSVGTTYGNQISFKTLPILPIITTSAVTSITSSSAVSGGNVISDGGASIKDRGLCWSIFANPTSDDSNLVDDGSLNTFSGTISPLSPGTTYSVRSFAINSVGTAYGNQISFKTLPILPTLSTTAASSITASSAISGGNVTNDGGATVSSRGICWATTQSPVTGSRIGGPQANAGTGTGIFTCVIGYEEGGWLESGSTYYVRSFATNSAGTTYGDQISFKTLAIPSVTTSAVTSVTSTNAISGGNVISDGGTAVTARGVCWSTKPTPSTDSDHLSAGLGIGAFTCTFPDSRISQLTTGVGYFVRAYAINSVGTAYGADVSFTTLAVPSITTAAATSITSTSAISGGNVISDGGASIKDRGLCWSIFANPTSDDSNLVDDGFLNTFSGTISSLSPGTTYSVRSFAINSAGTAYGNQISFKTLPTLPSITTAAATSITSTNAISGGNITSDGGATVSSRGICWSTSQNPVTSSKLGANQIFAGFGTGIFSCAIENGTLAPSTIYYVRAFALNSIGTAYGSEISFTTLAPVRPTLATTTAANSITSTSAISGGNILNDGGDIISERGICWNLIGTPTTNDSKTIETGSENAFTCIMNSLSPGTTYFVRSYATNRIGTNYGIETTFATLTTLPQITTSAVTSITSTSAISGGNITSDGGAAVNNRGVCWSVNKSPRTDGDRLSAGSGIGAFTCTFPDSRISQLTTGVGYFVRAYAINSVGTAYGANVSFTTLAVPSITTAAATSITSTSAISGGSIISDGGASIKDRGICWSIFADPTSDDSNLVDDGSLNTFSGTISSLSPGTTYSVRSFAINSVGTAYGNQISFKTLPTLPSTTTAAATSITSTNAISGGNITSDGGATVSSRGICWSTSQNPELSGMAGGPDAYAGSGTGTFSCTVGSDEAGQLQPGKTYYVRAFAINSVGTTYGNQISFKTLPILPIITTSAVTSITSSSAVSGGNVISDGGASIKDRGLCWSIFANPTSDDSNLVDDESLNTFSGTISPLSPGTTYSVRSFAINSVGTAYGNQISFKTLPILPTLSTTAASSITASSAISGGNVTNDGGATVSSRGICWATTQSPVTGSRIGGPQANAGTGTGIFTCVIGYEEGGWLESGSTYYVRSFATNSAGTTYGDQISFKTLAIPSVTTSAVTSVTSTNAISGGNVISDGGTAVTARGVCWSTKPTPSTDSDHLSAGLGIGAFTCTFPDSRISQLTTGVGYFVRAYAINSVGTAYGADVSFTTLAVPSITTAAATSITSTSAISGGNVISDGGASIKDRGLCWSIFANPTSDDSNLVDDGFLNTFSGTISSLSPGTTYSVRSFAINSVGTAYGNQISFKTLAILPTLSTTAASSITSTNAISGGNITSDGGATVNNRGICWATTQNPELSGMAGGPDAYAGSGTGTFSCTVGRDETGELQPGKTYYVRAFAINSVGTTYGNQISFKTLPILPIITTAAVTSITSTSAISGGSIISDGGAAVNSRGICWGTKSTPSTDGDYLLTGAGIGTFTCTFPDPRMPQLTTGVGYFVRAYAINSVGTAYGVNVRFTTLAVPSITTAAATSITSTSAISGGNISSDGGAAVTARGVCWNTTGNPATSSKFGANQIYTGTGTGIFSCNIGNSGLQPSTDYYIRAFAINSIGIVYGVQSSFRTLVPIPILETIPVSGIESSSAWSGGNITSIGSTAIKSMGICWDKRTTTPTINNSVIYSSVENNKFTLQLGSETPLSPNTTYYVRAFAENEIGVGYGNPVSFTTYEELISDIK